MKQIPRSNYDSVFINENIGMRVNVQELSHVMLLYFILFIYLFTFCDLLTSLIMIFITSDYRHEAAENCALLRYYAASSGDFLRTFLDNLSFPLQGSKIQEDPFGFLTP
jgi:hypothetical protein